MALRRPRQRLRPIYEFMRLLRGGRQGFTDGEASFQIIRKLETCQYAGGLLL